MVLITLKTSIVKGKGQESNKALLFKKVPTKGNKGSNTCMYFKRTNKSVKFQEFPNNKTTTMNFQREILYSNPVGVTS